MLVGGISSVWIYQRTYKAVAELAAIGVNTALLLPVVFWGLASVTLLLSSNLILDRLYLTSDLELLLVAPVPFRQVFLLKVLESMKGVILPGLTALVVLAAYGRAVGAGGLHYLWALLSILLVLAAVLALGLILVMLIARVFSPRAAQSLTQTLIGLLVSLVPYLILVGGRQDGRLNNWLLSEGSSRQLLSNWLAGDKVALLLSLSLLAGAVIALYAVAYRLFLWTFYESWSGFREVPIQRGRKRMGWLAAPEWPLRPKQAIILKDWAVLAREPRRMISLLAVPVGFGILLQPCLTGPLGRQLGPAAGLWVSFFLALCIAFFGSMTLGGRAIGSEGRNIALLRVAPLPAGQLMLAKFWSVYAPIATVTLLVGIGSGLLLGLSGVEVLIMMIGGAWCAAGCVAAAVGSDALGTSFQAEGERADISLSSAIGIYGLNPPFIGFSLLSLIWILPRLWPEHCSLTEIPALVLGASFLNSYYFSSGLLPGLSLLLTILGIVGVWKLGCRRLERWQIGEE